MDQNERKWVVPRHRMVTEQLISRGISDARVLEVMRDVPRHQFVSGTYQSDGYQDTPISIGSGQTISQPYIVALMTELLRLKNDNIVLEVGTGSGYHTAVLAKLAKQVFSIERVGSLAIAAQHRLARLGVRNVEIYEGDGSLGLPVKAPFDAILVAAASPATPEPLLEQLTENGRLIVPVGSRNRQRLQLYTLTDGIPANRLLTPVRFVPLLGKWGWED